MLACVVRAAGVRRGICHGVVGDRNGLATVIRDHRFSALPQVAGLGEGQADGTLLCLVGGADLIRDSGLIVVP